MSSPLSSGRPAAGRRRAILLLVAVAAWAAMLSNLLPDLTHRFALRGGSALDFSYRHAYPELFTRDWPTGVANLHRSSFMLVYPTAHRLLGITPETLVPLVVIFETLVLALAIVLLVRAVTPRAPPAFLVACATILVWSCARDMSLSHFVQPFFIGFHYNVADVLRVLSFVAVLRRRFVFAGVLIGLTLTVHPLLGAMGGAAAGGAALVTMRRADVWRITAAAAVVVTTGAAWWAIAFSNVGAGGGGIPPDRWLAFTRMLNYHWYPIESGLFSVAHHEVWLPLLSYAVLLMHYLRPPNVGREALAPLGVALAVAAGATVAGVAISGLSTTPFLIKFALHRGCGLFILLSLPFVLLGLWRDATSRRRPAVLRMAATILLLSPFFATSSATWPLLFVVALVVPREVLELANRPRPRTAAVAALLLAICGFFVWWAAIGVLRSPWTNAYTAGAFLTTRLGVLVTAAVVALSAARAPRSTRAAALVALVCLLAVGWTERRRLPPSQVARATAYADAQHWAREHTAADALFMTDPAINYGWRDYSRRSSFGTPREWLHNAWLYNSQRALFDEGLRRAAELDLPLDDLLASSNLRWLAARRLNAVASNRYNRADDAWRTELARRWAIDYFVLEKAKLAVPTALPVAYENRQFLIVRASGDGIEAHHELGTSSISRTWSPPAPRLRARGLR